MSILRAGDGPPLHVTLSYLAGKGIVKRAGIPQVVYNLSGVLYLSKSGWLLLSVPNALARGVFDAMDEHGIELPPSEHNENFNAHISVMSKSDLEMIGGADKVTERGKRFSYTIGRMKEVVPDSWPGIAKVWFLTVHSPDLQQLRRSYGLSSLPHGGEYDFHITCAVLRKGVLGRNETAKETR